MKKFACSLLLSFTFLLFAKSIKAQLPLSERLAKTAMTIWKDSMALKPKGPAKWTYDQGLVLKGVEGVWKRTGNGDYFSYIKKSMDFFVKEDGTIRTYKMEDYNIDNVNPGRNLLMLYNVLSDNKKYLQAVKLLREQLNYHPRTNEGGFWHKKIYPYQMWLDGLYMGAPFYAEYSVRFNQPESFEDIANQFIWIENHTRDKKTGLLYHGWDESKKEKWANPETGCSPHFWGRAMGWYAMAIVDVLDHFPADHPKRGELLAIFNRMVVALKKVQDPKTGLWWQILDKGGVKGNYLEASCSNMFVYAIAKGVRLGYLNKSFLPMANKGFVGINKHFISVDPATGLTNLNRVCQVAGLGGRPYRDGSFEYYINEPIITNDPKGLGAAILAAVEMEILKDQVIGKGKKVALDSYFNNERKKDELKGSKVPYHYKWEETDNGGFSFLGDIFKNYGVNTTTLYDAPTKANLKGTDIYVIVDPDFPKENPTPNYIEETHINEIKNWVKSGGVLVLMTNDSNNVEFEKTNLLAKQFGIQFNQDSRNRVEGDDYEVGKVTAPAIFSPKKKFAFIKQVSTLKVTPPAKAILVDKGDVLMAVSKFGKGTVFAIGDPWLYNEYVDGRKIPAKYQNYSVAQDWVKWLIKQVPAKVSK